MKPAELQDKVKAAVAKLSEAAGLTDEKDAERADGMVKDAIATLRECETASIEPVVKIEEKRVEVPGRRHRGGEGPAGRQAPRGRDPGRGRRARARRGRAGP